MAFAPRFLAAALVAAPLLLSAPTQAATPDAPYAAVGLGAGAYIYLPAVRAHVRYARPAWSLEGRWGVLIPSLFVLEEEGLGWEAELGPRLHVLRRERAVLFTAARGGVWRIHRKLNPVATATFGADWFFDPLVLTAEAGAGAAWGPSWNVDAVFLIETSVQAGWTF